MNQKRSPRDPEGRRRAIVHAATELVLELGLHQVSHRKIAERAGVPLGSTTQHFATLDDLLIAAVAELAAPAQDYLRELHTSLEESADRPRTLARFLTDYLSDADRVRAEAVFYVAHAEHPQMREMTAHWYEGMAELLNRYMSPASARSVALYVDGLTMSVALADLALDEDEITLAVTKLMGE